MTFARAAKKVKMHRDVITALSLSLSHFLSVCLSVCLSLRDLPRRGKSSSLSLRRQIGVEKHRERWFVWGTIEGQCISGRCATVQSNIHTRTHIHIYIKLPVTTFMQSGAGCRVREKGFLHSGLFTSLATVSWRISYCVCAVTVIFHDNCSNNFWRHLMYLLNTPSIRRYLCPANERDDDRISIYAAKQ